MSKFVRATWTSQSLSLAAMEEASRVGLREADIEHLFLALVINDQVAGTVLRDLGIDLEAARLAVGEQHAAQLSSLGVDAAFPAPGRIAFHETDGYQWSKRAADLIARSGREGREGDAAAVLRELVVEPSGLISGILHRLDTSPPEVLARLDQVATRRETVTPRTERNKERVSGSSMAFAPASIERVWEFLADPARVPDWEVSIGSIEGADQEPRPGMVWEGRAPLARPDGKPLKMRSRFYRRKIELAATRRPNRVAWTFGYPDAPRSHLVTTEFRLAATTGGTQVTITRSWTRQTGWRRLAGLPLRPLQKSIVWLGLFQTGDAISRAFR